MSVKKFFGANPNEQIIQIHFLFFGFAAFAASTLDYSSLRFNFRSKSCSLQLGRFCESPFAPNQNIPNRVFVDAMKVQTIDNFEN